ncbi:NfeD family protein [Wenzhouxiangella sp. XN201]|uniref:NfeD family protein n=1 Tax=Wenzhouxiangella sp. XN201 TaxID=2710755 RepID=UPI0013C96180|nr:NfeD family protein [Wenzhouxiangella sp. XN201]NEZ04614.1 NfeD family protein [Wenzhouxiangella sp. XN201]
MIEQSWFWLILGALLILSEFFITGIVAIFFGVGAILVGIATAVGLLDSLPEQVLSFSVLSVGSLLFARERIKIWFRGNVSDRWDGDRDLIATRGERVTVTRGFSQGVGQVRLSGADWKAECEDGDLAEGDIAWVIGHRGITLLVSANRPEHSHDHSAS